MDEAQITRTGAPPWLALVAVTLALAVGVGLVVSAGGGPSDAIEEPAPMTPPTPREPADAGALLPDGAPSRGSGQVVAVSPDGSWLYVMGLDPRGGTGCDGLPRAQLFVERTDGLAGGDRRPALDGTVQGWVTLVFGPDGTVAIRAMCEPSASTLGIGAIAEDGTITDHRVLEVRDHFTIPVDLAWSSADELVVAGSGYGPEQRADGRGLYEISADTGAVTALEPDGVLLLDATADGVLVTRDNVGTVRVGEEVLGSEGQVHGLDVSDDGRFVVTTGAYGVTVYDRETGRDERIADSAAYDPSILGTGDVIFHTRDSEGVGRVVGVHLGEVGSGDHAVATLFNDRDMGQLVRSAVAPDGSHLWVSYVERQGDPPPALLSQPLTR